MGIVVLSEAASTMDAAREILRSGHVSLWQSGGAEPGGVMALDQTDGRGQRGRNWYSYPGESLCVTYFVPLTAQLMRGAGKIAILAGVAVVNALDAMFSNIATHVQLNTVTTRIDSSPFGLKWPNDIFLVGKKVGGILIEIVSDPGKSMVALIGVGLNVGVRRFPPEIATLCTSLAIEGLFPESLESLANGIRTELDRFIDVELSLGFSATMEAWRRYDLTAGGRYSTVTKDGIKVGSAIEVDADGALVLQLENGELLSVLCATSAFD
jgi:BirA family biotin operon repressor/biotin-[acetyl-CoA-carboxylase] ligase